MTIIPFNSGKELNSKQLNGRKLFTAYWNGSNKDVYITDCGLYFYHGGNAIWAQMTKEHAENMCWSMLNSLGYFKDSNNKEIEKRLQNIQVQMWMA